MDLKKVNIFILFILYIYLGIISSNFTLKNLFFENKKQALNFKSDKMEENGIVFFNFFIN